VITGRAAHLPQARPARALPAQWTALRKKVWPLVKSLQTGLLLVTGIAGYASACCPLTHAPALLGMAAALFLAISGSTVLNMWYDRDIDAIMRRTCARPLPAGLITPRQALVFGLALSSLGVGGALLLSPLFGLVVFAGLFFDVAVYTIWLKRRTAWSVVWGGIAGGMPILAGRTLAVGQIDAIGLLLAAAILFWIPTHIMTFSLRNAQDYAAANLPTFPSVYGVRTTQITIALSSLLAALSIGGAAVMIGMQLGYLSLLVLLSAGLMVLACRSLLRPSERVNFSLFKYASFFMLSAMLLVVITAL
jgi:heme o synthase